MQTNLVVNDLKNSQDHLNRAEACYGPIKQERLSCISSLLLQNWKLTL